MSVVLAVPRHEPLPAGAAGAADGPRPLAVAAGPAVVVLRAGGAAPAVLRPGPAAAPPPSADPAAAAPAPAAVRAVAFAGGRRGGWVAAGGDDKSVRLWDVGGEEAGGAAEGPAAPRCLGRAALPKKVCGLAGGPAGWLSAADRFGDLWALDLAAVAASNGRGGGGRAAEAGSGGAEPAWPGAARLGGHYCSSVTALDSYWGDLLASADREGKVRVARFPAAPDLGTDGAAEIQSFCLGHGEAVLACKFHSSLFLVTADAGADGEVAVWRTADGERLAACRVGAPVVALDLAAHGVVGGDEFRHIAVATEGSNRVRFLESWLRKPPTAAADDLARTSDLRLHPDTVAFDGLEHVAALATRYDASGHCRWLVAAGPARGAEAGAVGVFQAEVVRAAPGGHEPPSSYLRAARPAAGTRAEREALAALRVPAGEPQIAPDLRKRADDPAARAERKQGRRDQKRKRELAEKKNEDQ